LAEDAPHPALDQTAMERELVRGHVVEVEPLEQQLPRLGREVLAAMDERFEFQPVGGKGLHPPSSI
jgi:hypothetical protein